MTIRFILCNLIATFVLAQAAVCHADQSKETLVFFRHGEKPEGGLGQITCKGLNRALALPNILLSKYRKPDYLFAPNPAGKMHDPAGHFYYVRPLATIEPTAIRLGMPVQTPYKFTEINELKNELLSKNYRDSTIFIAWEHLRIREIVQNILSDLGGNPEMVQKWQGNDYDSIYVIKILTDVSGRRRVEFMQDQEGLDYVSDTCP